MDSGFTGNPTPINIPQKGLVPAIGETLIVKRFFKPSPGSSVYAGDFLTVVDSISNTPGKISVRHPYSTAVFETDFLNFLPLGPHEMCYCKEEELCRCIFEDYEKSRAFTNRSLLELASRISDPSTHEGQRTDAYLRILRKPWHGSLESPDLKVEVGDIVQSLGGVGKNKDPSKIYARNIRTGQKGGLLWRAVFSVGRRERCNCMTENQKCRCIYDDFDASMEYCNSHPDIDYSK